MNSKMMIVEATSESRRRTVVIVEIPFAKLTIYLEQKNINNGFLLGNVPIGPSERGFPTRRRIGNRTAKSVYITRSGAESGGDSSPMIPLKPQDDPESIAASISSQC
jgi:hypothetical protein